MNQSERIFLEFEEKVAIITGGARGIGRATAMEFIKHGARVAIVDLREKELEEVSKTIQKMSREVLPIKGDVSNNNDVQEAIRKTLDRFGKIDILINNAGIGDVIGPVINTSEEDWDRVLRVNLKSVFLFSKGVVPFMIKNKSGSIVNVASLAGKEGNENMAPYSVSKAGIICFSRVLAKEVVKYGIRVNSVAPALIKTDFTSIPPKEVIDSLISKIPMGRMGLPEEVANLILFLCSDRASFITGQCFNVSGGRGDY
jgi:3-oxoacyl-[acyl-carrier protein] reductase